MQETINSDCNLTMLAIQAFEDIIDNVQSSGLNFQLQISPFSAIISLKKSLVRDRSGNPIIPNKYHQNVRKTNEHIEALIAKNNELERKLADLTYEHKEVVDDFNEARQTIKNMKFQLNTNVKVEEGSSSLIEELIAEGDGLKHEVDNLNDEIRDLKLEGKKAKEVFEKLNKNIRETRIKFEKEKAQTLKDHRVEVKEWRKELGEANRKIVKLEKKVNATVDDIPKPGAYKVKLEKVSQVDTRTEDTNENICNICAANIFNYLPEYFCGEPYNPTCEDCKANDSSWAPDDPFSSFPSPHPPPSLVSHWFPVNVNAPRRPGSIPSMIAHCPKFPPPGSSFISMEEVLEMMREFFKRPLFGLDEK